MTSTKTCEKSTSLIRVFFMLNIFLSSCVSQYQNGDQTWRIYSHFKEDFKFIQLNGKASNLFKETWRQPTEDNPSLDIVVSKTSHFALQRWLTRHKFKYQVLTADIKSSFENHSGNPKINKKVDSLEDFNFGIYHPYKEIWEWMDLIISSYANVKQTQIGVTYEGRPMLALSTMQSSPIGSKPVIFVDALAHSREWVATASTIYAFNEIFKNNTLLDLVDWIFLPMVNVDGYAFTWTEGNRLWRKSMHKGAKVGCDGVDINRNWNISWGQKLASTDEPCSENYFGPTAFSESESRHRANFIYSNKEKIKAYVTVHSYAQVIAYPYNYNISAKPDNIEIQGEIAKEMSEAMYAVNGTRYQHGQAAEVLYEASGISTDWTQKVAEIDINYTFELRDRGKYGFVLPEDQIIPTGMEFLAAMQVLANKVHEMYDAKPAASKPNSIT